MIVAIGGISRAGKTWLSNKIAEKFRTNPIEFGLIHLDDYCKTKENLPRIKDQINWEVPGSVDTEKLKKEIDKQNDKCDIVIVEGHLIFALGISHIFNKRLYLSLTKKSFLDRKKIDNRWGKVPEWYMDYIWKAGLKYSQPPSNFDFFFLSGESTIQVDLAINYIES